MLGLQEALDGGEVLPLEVVEQIYGGADGDGPVTFVMDEGGQVVFVHLKAIDPPLISGKNIWKCVKCILQIQVYFKF